MAAGSRFLGGGFSCVDQRAHSVQNAGEPEVECLVVALHRLGRCHRCGNCGESVLSAGELAGARADHKAALTAYEQRMRAYARRWQRGANPGKFFAPATGRGLALRNRLLAASMVRRMLLSGTKSLATDADLPDYP